MRLPPFLFLLCLLLLSAAKAEAELKWLNPSQSFLCAPSDVQLSTHFDLVNTGTSAVTITRVVTSCGCTTSRLSKRTFAPAESGSIGVVFTFGDRRGRETKTITVSTSDSRQYLLQFDCLIQDYLIIKPTLVFWRINEPPTPKTIEIVTDTPQAVRVTSAKSSDPRMSASLETLESGKQYALHLAPAGTGQPTTAQITLQTDFPAASPKRYTVCALVK